MWLTGKGTNCFGAVLFSFFHCSLLSVFYLYFLLSLYCTKQVRAHVYTHALSTHSDISAVPAFPFLKAMEMQGVLSLQTHSLCLDELCLVKSLSPLCSFLISVPRECKNLKINFKIIFKIRLLNRVSLFHFEGITYVS